MCIIGEIVCGRTVSPWNSICVVNALFKAINTLSGSYTQEECGMFCLTCVCVCLCVAWCGGWGCVSVCVGCGATLWSSPGSRCVEELSGCWRGLPERGETRKLQTFSSELTAPSASNYLDAQLQLCALMLHTPCAQASTWSEPSSFPPLCVWCGQWRTSALKSISFFFF